MLLITLLALAALPPSLSATGESALVWDTAEISSRIHFGELHSIEVPGFSSCQSGVLLPEKRVMIPVPVTGDVSLRVVPSGVRSLGPPPPLAMSSFDEGREVFTEAPPSSIPTDWGGIAERGTFRRAGYVSVRLNPVILSGGELLAADGLSIELDHSPSGVPARVGGHEGEIFQAVFGTDEVWREPAGRALDSPFWGKPWARIQVDTAGVYAVTGDMIPEAVGMPTGSFSMITGRGEMMSFDDPASHTFAPRPVPIHIDDGGDGTFDSSDRILFYGRGLSWWGGFMGDHFNSRYSGLNTYWLTWGGEGGPFMEVLDGSLTGAPSAGDSYVNRLHFEENGVLAPSFNAFEDFYGWHRITSGTANYAFATPGATGSGSMRLGMYLEKGNGVQIRASVNGTQMADTLISSPGAVEWEFDATGFKTSGNSLSLNIQSGSTFVLYTGWFQAFPETGYRSWSTMCQVPLDRQFQSGQRRLISWAQNLGPEAFVCLARSDTEAALIDIPGGKDFEVELPGGWSEPVMWVVPGGSFLEPVSVSPAAPGRILGTISSGATAYIYPDHFADDMPLFLRGRTDVLFLSLTEIYDEFNGGVPDPGAIRAFFQHTLMNWDEPLDQMVLVGSGHWDPRGFLTENTSFVDILVYQFYSGNPICSDNLYTVTPSSILPQGAVSRIPATGRGELQLVAQKSAEYADLSSGSGTWQSVVLGAADDERSPKNPSGDELDHTEDSEEVFLGHVPNRFVPLRHYLIFWNWNSFWKKPEARAAYIENWSRGALVSFFLGHGSFDQIVDEGLLYIEDAASLACGPRQPYAFFGSCDVGFFQNPAHRCIAGDVTLVSGGGAIVSSGAATVSNGRRNAAFLKEILDIILHTGQFTIGEGQWLGLVNHGDMSNDKPYIVFGDGSLHLALPDSRVSVTEPELFTSRLCQVQGTLQDTGLVMLTAWESARPDSYYTLNNSYLIEHLSTPGVFYRGLAPASPEFTGEMFVPEVAATGDLARIRYFAPGSGGGSLECSYPLDLQYGTGSPDDTTGPVIDMWIAGFQGVENPSVSGSVVFEALLSDDSGINLLPYPGNQLALYIDETPVDVSEYFTYQPGSATTGGIVYPLPELQPGDHTLKLRAADNLSNISWREMTFHLAERSSPEISQLFVYPTPASTVLSFNWTQSSSGPVDLAIYTVSGRLIAERGNLPGEAGYNQHTWDLTDSDGDRIASGTYIYRLSAGESEVTGVAAVAR